MCGRGVAVVCDGGSNAPVKLLPRLAAAALNAATLAGRLLGVAGMVELVERVSGALPGGRRRGASAEGQTNRVVLVVAVRLVAG